MDLSVTDDVVVVLDVYDTLVGATDIVITGEDVVVDGERIRHSDVDLPWATYGRLVREADESNIDE